MKKTYLLICLATLGLFQYCTSSKKVQAPPKITYDANVHPIVMSTCSPCHISPSGKQKTLNNYMASKTQIDEVLTRIQKKPTEKGFMPFKHPKLPDSTVQVFIRWKNDGLLEK